MEDRKNFAKLNDEQLEQVSGGFEQIDEDTWHFEAGDAFDVMGFMYYITEPATAKRTDSIWVEERYMSSEGPVVNKMIVPVWHLLEGTHIPKPDPIYG